MRLLVQNAINLAGGILIGLGFAQLIWDTPYPLFEARRHSPRPLPRSGSFLLPKKTKTITPMIRRCVGRNRSPTTESVLSCRTIHWRPLTFIGRPQFFLRHSLEAHGKPIQCIAYLSDLDKAVVQLWLALLTIRDRLVTNSITEVSVIVMTKILTPTRAVYPDQNPTGRTFIRRMTG